MRIKMIPWWKAVLWAFASVAIVWLMTGCEATDIPATGTPTLTVTATGYATVSPVDTPDTAATETAVYVETLVYEPTSTMWPWPTPTQEVNDQAKVTATSGLNVRSGPSAAASIIGGLPYGTVVKVLDFSDDGTWWRVSVPNGITGWCSSAWLEVIL